MIILLPYIKNKFLFAFTITLGLLLTNLHSEAQNLNNKGTDFWVTYPAQLEVNGKHVLYLLAEENTIATVTAGGNNVIFQGDLLAGQVKAVTIPNNYYVQASEQIEAKGIFITAAKSITVTSHLYSNAGLTQNRSSVALVLPTPALGKEYYAFTLLPQAAASSFAEFIIVATENDTEVIITPTASTEAGRAANQPFPVQLKAGETFQVKSKGDLTGSSIRSCKNIAVFSGNAGTTFNCNGVTSSGNLYQQLLPVATWGKAYVSIPFRKKTGSQLKIIAAENNTSITINGNVFAINAAKGVLLVPATDNVTSYITATKPIAVTQVNCNGNFSDPEMVVLSPQEQAITKASLYSVLSDNGTGALTNLREHYLNVVMATADVSTFRINGQAPTGSFVPLPNSNGLYAYLQEDLSGSATNKGQLLEAGGKGFNAVAYGFAASGNPLESYAFMAGTRLDDLNKSITTSQKIAGELASCQNEPVNFTATLPYTPTSIKWDFGDGTGEQVVPDLASRTSPSHEFAQPGLYMVKLITINPNNPCNTPDITTCTFKVIEKPKARFDVAGTCYQEITAFTDKSTAPAGSTITSWSWDFGDPASGATNTAAVASPTHVFSAPGDYEVKLTITAGNTCVGIYTQKITIAPLPVALFKADAVCETGETAFTDLSTLPVGTITKWEWDFGDGKTAATRHPRHIYNQANNYQVKLKITTDKGCTVTHTQQVTVYPKPVAAITASDACVNIPVQFQDASTIASGSITSWRWEFGDGTISTDKNPGYTYRQAGIYSVKLTVKSGFNCESFIEKKVTVFVAPEAQAGPDQLQLCGETNTALAASKPMVGTGTWSIVSGTGGSFGDINQFNTSFSGKAGELYKLRWTVKNGPCTEAFDELDLKFNLLPAVEAGPNQDLFRNESTTLAGSGSGTFAWFPATGLSNAAIPNPVATPEKTTTYTLTVTSPEGCVARDSVIIKILDKLTIPNAFSPNNDGINDTWKIKGLSDYPEATVEVYDRWGSKIFTGDAMSAWDGTRNGKLLPMATYYYIISQNNGNKPVKGQISIIK